MEESKGEETTLQVGVIREALEDDRRREDEVCVPNGGESSVPEEEVVWGSTPKETDETFSKEEMPKPEEA